MSLIVSVPVRPANSGKVFRKLIRMNGTSRTHTDAAAPKLNVAGRVVVDCGTVEDVEVDGVVEELVVVGIDDEVVVVGTEEVVVLTTVVGGAVEDVVTSLVVEEVDVDPIVVVVPMLQRISVG